LLHLECEIRTVIVKCNNLFAKCPVLRPNVRSHRIGTGHLSGFNFFLSHTLASFVYNYTHIYCVLIYFGNYYNSGLIYFCYKYSQMPICIWMLCILGPRFTKSNFFFSNWVSFYKKTQNKLVRNYNNSQNISECNIYIIYLFVLPILFNQFDCVCSTVLYCRRGYPL